MLGLGTVPTSGIRVDDTLAQMSFCSTVHQVSDPFFKMTLPLEESNLRTSQMCYTEDYYFFFFFKESNGLKHAKQVHPRNEEDRFWHTSP